MKSRICLTALALSIIVFNSPDAFGQVSAASVSATYTLLRDPDLDFTFERGVSLGGACRLYGWLFVSAELALNYHHQDYSAVQGGTYDFAYQSLQAGPRVVPFSGRVQPYIEVLTGATRLGLWERRLDRTGQWGAAEFSVQPGIGVDVFLSRQVAVRFAGDVRVLFKHDNRFDKDYRARLYRFNTGMAFHLK